MTARVRVENQRSRARSMVRLATTASRMAGTAAMTENRPTIRTWSRAPAWPRRRARMTCQTSRAISPSSTRTVTALTSRIGITTSLVGSTGVRLLKMRKVTSAESSATATVTGPSTPLANLRTGPAGAAASATATSSTLVMNPQTGKTETRTLELMLFYNNVARLRQFRGVHPRIVACPKNIHYPAGSQRFTPEVGLDGWNGGYRWPSRPMRSSPGRGETRRNRPRPRPRVLSSGWGRHSVEGNDEEDDLGD